MRFKYTNKVKKVKIIELTEKTIFYEDCDSSTKFKERVLMSSFNETYNIIEKLLVETRDCLIKDILDEN